MSWITDAIARYRAGEIAFPTLRDTLAQHLYRPQPEDPELAGDTFSQDYGSLIAPGSWNGVCQAMDRALLTDAEYYGNLDAHHDWVDARG